MDAPETAAGEVPALRRRDFLKWSILGAAGYALVKSGLHSLLTQEAVGTWRNLSPAHAKTFSAAALAIAGPTARTRYAEQAWDPAGDFDRLLDRVPEEQRGLMLTGLTLFEHWTPLGGFSTLSPERQLAHLSAWSTSRLTLRRTVWGLLHAATAVSFGSRAGWNLMGYPGPCVPSDGHTGRPPGQSALFFWDESVP